MGGAARALQAVRGSALTVVDAGLAPGLVPLAWLVGRWEGDGVLGYPTMAEDLPFAQQVEVSHDGRPFLLWHSRTWALDPAGERQQALATEVGYWRVLPAGHAEAGRAEAERAEAGDGSGAPGDGVAVELLLSHASGVVEMYAGRAVGGRVDVATDAVLRSPVVSSDAVAPDYAAATRLYGQVEGDLLWAMDMSAGGRGLTPHASARLRRVPVP